MKVNVYKQFRSSPYNHTFHSNAAHGGSHLLSFLLLLLLFFLTFLDHFFSWTKGIKLTCLRLSKRWLKGHTKKAKKILSRITKRKKSCVDYHLLSLQFHWNLETCSKKSIPDYHLAYSHPFAVIMYSYLILTKITC